MLGVRHKGFIPWDDDMDICVPAENYQKLLKLLNKEVEIDNNLFLYFINNNIPKFWFKVFATKKIIMQNRNRASLCSIDIFPARIINKSDEVLDRKITNILKNIKDNIEFDKKYLKNTLKNAMVEKNKFMEYFYNEYMPTCNSKDSDSLVSYSKCYSEDYHKYEDIFPLQ